MIVQGLLWKIQNTEFVKNYYSIPLISSIRSSDHKRKTEERTEELKAGQETIYIEL